MKEVKMSFDDFRGIVLGKHITGDRKVTGYVKYDMETQDMLYNVIYLTPEEEAAFIAEGGEVL